MLDEVSRAETERELAQIREELTEQGYLHRRKGKQKPLSQLPPLEFKSSDGFKILVGRNNRQNDKLTLKTASKNDMWLHTKDIHGSHTIIFADGREISDTSILRRHVLRHITKQGKTAVRCLLTIRLCAM